MFVHLHLHTQYSLLDGATQIDPLIASAKGFQMPAVAMTDHGNLFGAIEFYRKVKAAGMKPIIGCEVYLAPRSRFDKEGLGSDDDYAAAGGGNPYYHLILLAANETGYKNLIRLISIANLEGFYYKPRIDKEVLAKHSAGLICLSGCLRGEIPYLLARGYEKEAITAAGTYQEIFDKGHFFIEIQDNRLELQNTVNRQLIALSKKCELPLVATNDCHYLHKEDVRAHDVLLCLQTGKTLNMPNRMKFQTEELYFKSPEVMRAAFSELPGAISNTLQIAERVNLELKFGEVHLPHYTVPKGITHEAYLEGLAQAGLEARFGKMKEKRPEDRARYEARLKEELAIINSMKYAGYFLIVWDIIRYARSAHIPVGPGRGSAAGSLAAYVLGITDIDPISHGLIFERFLNPERISLPDIDMDFCQDRRGEVIRYVTEKYGPDHVCQIITFGTMAARGVIRDVGRVLELPLAETDRLAKLVPNVLNITLDKALEQEPRLRESVEKNPKVAELMDLARQLEGTVRNAGTHAAGIVISEEPLTEHLPLYRGAHGETVTQYAMGDIEKIGLIKFDFLGLRTLTVIDHAVRLINAGGEATLDLAEIPLTDPKTYALLGSGQTTGIFQLESAGMRDILVKMQSENFEDIVAILALYRPGPIGSGMVDDFIKRKRKPTKIEYELPQLKEILSETYGVIVYQEQVMKIANVLAGFSLGEADLLRRAMGKKKPEEMAAQKATFIERAAKNKIPPAKAEKIFDLMEYFAGYGFNKSHSAAYAVVTYQTAYLKCHHPLAFMAALLTSERGNSDKVVQYIGECKRMGIRILPPDVNGSEKDFTVVTEGIRFGLEAVKNVGSGAIDSILAARKSHGHFASIFDFCEKIDLRKTNKRVIESLIKCGAFDSMKMKRAVLMNVLDQAMTSAGQRLKEGDQVSLFEDLAPASLAGRNDIPEWDEAQLARYEKEMVGFYITSHPLSRYEETLKKISATPMESLESLKENDPVRIGCVIVQERVTTTRRGDKMAYLRVEDLTGSVEVIVFPELYALSRVLMSQEGPLLISGTIDQSEKGVKVKATAMVLLSDPDKKPSRVVLALNEDLFPPSRLVDLRELLKKFPGPLPLYLRMTPASGKGAIVASMVKVDQMTVAGSRGMQEAVKGQFSEGVTLFVEGEES